MIRVLIDTDVIIECLKKNLDVISELERLSNNGIVVSYSPMSKAEVYCGIRKKEEGIAAEFFDQMECLTITDDTGEKAGRYLHAFRKSHAVELGDALIAATAFSAKATLFTFNQKHYPMKDIELYAFCRDK